MAFFKIRKAKVDWTAEMLPRNRKELFFDIFKLHFFNFLYYGLFLLILSFPMHLLALVNDLYESNMFSVVTEMTTKEELTNIYSNVILFKNSTAIIIIPLFCLFGVLFSGFARVIRQYSYLENVSFWHDYVLGIKQNWKQYLLLSLCSGILYSVIIIGINNNSLSPDSNILFLIFLGFTIIFILPILAITSILIPTYNNTFFTNIKIAVSLFLKNPFKVLGVMILCSLIYIPYFIPDFYTHIFGRLLATIFTPFVVLIFYLVCLNMFDKTINSRQFPEAVGRGLYKEKNL